MFNKANSAMTDAIGVGGCRVDNRKDNSSPKTKSGKVDIIASIYIS